MGHLCPGTLGRHLFEDGGIWTNVYRCPLRRPFYQGGSEGRRFRGYTLIKPPDLTFSLGPTFSRILYVKNRKAGHLVPPFHFTYYSRSKSISVEGEG